MERFASTLATTAACVGLMVAGHLAIVHERASVPDEPVKVRVLAANAAATETTAWADPPAKPDLPAAETTGTVAANPAAVEPAPAAEPAAVASPVVQAPVQHTALKADKAKRAAEQARRKKLAQAKAKRTQTASRDVPADQVGAPAATPQAEPAPAPRFNPIGDLLYGLGIGGRQG